MTNEIQKISTADLPTDFLLWVMTQSRKGSVEISVSDGFVSYVTVSVVNEEDWSDVRFGRIIVTDVCSIKQIIYKPCLVKGEFTANLDAKYINSNGQK